MAKVYMVRHQRAGILTQFVFKNKPTDAQIAPIKAECERLHGGEVNGKPAWIAVYEAELIEDSVPEMPKPAAGRASGAAQFTIKAEGVVTEK